MRKAHVLHHGAAHTPGPGLREAGGKNLVGDGGAGSLGAAPCQHGEPAVQRQRVGAATVSDVEIVVASFVFQISSKFLLWPTLLPNHTENNFASLNVHSKKPPESPR